MVAHQRCQYLTVLQMYILVATLESGCGQWTKFWKGTDHSRTLFKFSFIPSCCSEIVKRFLIFNQSEIMADILNEGHGSQTQY